MTARQQQRLELAERALHIAIRHNTSGLTDTPYEPDIISALLHGQECFEKQGDLKPGSLDFVGRHADALRSALFAWMESVGIDPQSRDKAESKRMVMELAKDALGEGYEGNVEQVPGKGPKWVEHTADERASGLMQEFSSGKIKSHEELRIAMAAEILEAEHVARDPFLVYAKAIFSSCQAKQQSGEVDFSEEESKALSDATSHLMVNAHRWLNFTPIKKKENA